MLVPASGGEPPPGTDAGTSQAGENANGVDGEPPAVNDLIVRELDGGGELAEAAALALAGQAANGRLVLLTSGRITSSEPWYDALEQVLAGRRAGGVGTAMRFESGPGALWFGRSFADERLAARPLGAWPHDGPVPVPLLPSALSLYPRRVFAASGGIDGEFSSLAAAIDELSIRLWRMGFRCMVAAQVEASAPAPDPEDARDDAGELHDRMRIATLHFGPERLRAFLESAGREPAFEQAAARLAASDTERRRASIEALCARSDDWYLQSFPPGRPGPVELPAGAQGRKLGTIRRIRRRVRRR